MPNEATNSPNASFDPITLEVLWTRLISTVDEAAAALVRTSFSTVVRDSHCLLYTSPSPRDRTRSRMPSSA